MKRVYRLLKKILKKNCTCVVDAIQYIYEMFVSVFDRRIRIRFTNWWDYFYNGSTSKPIYTRKQNYVCEHMWLKNFEHIYSLGESDKKTVFRAVKHYDPHIEFFSVFGDVKKIKKSMARVKMFYTPENVNDTFHPLLLSYQGNCIDSMDLSLGFNHINANNYIRYPYFTAWYFSLFSSKDEIKAMLDIAKRQYQKSKFCSLIASHDVSGLRTKIYDDVIKIAKVDCPGKLLHNDDTLNTQYKNEKRMYLQQYKFNICPENSIGDGYVTEKLFESLLSGCIPIYNGYSKNPEPDIINPNIILWYDELDEENNKYTLNEMKKLYENDTLYRSFVEQPFFCDTAVDKIYDTIVSVKEKIREILVSKKII